MRVMVTGGAGYIGSHAVFELLKNGHEVVVLDDLSQGHLEAIHPDALFVRGSTQHYDLVARTLNLYKIEAVLHFAAHIEVGESIENPNKYYHNNFSNTLNLLRAMVENKVKKLVFSSTAAVYGEPLHTPIDESHPRQALNPYGRSKMMSELMIEDFSKAYGLSFTILRYFNVAGASVSGSIGEDHRPETHLIPRILKSALSPHPEIKIYGTDYPTPDGTCIRDYVHVVDLAKAHILALHFLDTKSNNIFNIGSENGFSVRQIIDACQKITTKQFRIKEEDRRPGDPAVLIANSQKIQKVLGWQRSFPAIDTIVEHAWNWHSKFPYGYPDSSIERKKDRDLSL